MGRQHGRTHPFGAERILTAARLFNVKQGLTADDDRLPPRFFEDKTDGPFVAALDREKMEKAKRYYYTLMGWDRERGADPGESR